MDESEIRSLFLDVLGTLSLNKDVYMQTPGGRTVEYGMAITETAFVTYREEDNTLHFYLDGEELLELEENSPVLCMMRELFVEVDEGDPVELKRARFRVLE